MKEIDRKKIGLGLRTIPADDSATWTWQKNSIASRARTRGEENEVCANEDMVSCYGGREANYTTLWRHGHDINDLCLRKNQANDLPKIAGPTERIDSVAIESV